MALPDVSITVKDGGLALLPADAGNTLVTLGVCPYGTPNTLYGFADPNQALATLGPGPLAEAVCLKLATAGSGSVQYAMPIEPSSGGGMTEVATVIGAATAIADLHAAPLNTIVVRITAKGTKGTGKFSYRLGNGPWSASITIPSSGDYAVPGTYTTLTFVPGAGAGDPPVYFEQGDVFTVYPTTIDDTNADVTRHGTSTGNITPTSSPADTYRPAVKITVGGLPGAAKFRYTLDYHTDDKGNDLSSYSAEMRTADELVPMSIPGSGLAVAFSGDEHTAGDVYTWRTCPPGFTATELDAALGALLALSPQWAGVHVVGVPATASAARLLADVLSARMEAATGIYRYAYALMECPTAGSIVPPSAALSTETDSDVAEEFSDFASTRVLVGAGDAEVSSLATGRSYRRSVAWLAGARLALAPIQDDLGRLASGPVPGVSALYRDEALTPMLGDARFVTARTYIGQPGYYLATSRTMAGETSDYRYVQARRVMDRACQVARSALLRYLLDNVRVNRSTGAIKDTDANTIEGAVNSQLVAALGNAVTSSSIRVDRTANILSTGILPVAITITPFATFREITVTIGFGLQQAAA